MNRETAQYLNGLLADRERLLKGALKGLSETKKGSSSIKVDSVLQIQTNFELAQIYQAQKVCDRYEEESRWANLRKN